MPPRRITSPVIFFALLPAWLSGSSAWAQSDRVYPLDGKVVSGTIESITKGGVAIKVGGNSQNIAAGEIEKVMFQGDPAQLTRGREAAIDGQYEQALDELGQIDIGSLSRDAIKADAAFYLMLCRTKLALAGQGDKTAAAAAAVDFTRTFPDSWHHYESQRLTGDLALALNKYDQANVFYESMMQSPSPITKIESVYLSGLAQLAKGDAQAAGGLFDKVIGLNVPTPAALRMQALSKAGKAVSLAQGGQADAGLKLVDALIADMNPTDAEMGARIYNAQGACYEAKQDVEGAILAYLHTHLLFSGISDAHAQSLYRLVELWPQVGKPNRAAEAKQELQQRYPGYGR